MSTDAGRTSPLDHFTKTTGSAVPVGQAGVVISERPFLGHLNLRGDPSDRAFMDGVERALGLALPVEPNTVSVGDALQALWLGPDEWLIVTPRDEQVAVADALVEALVGVFASVTDITGGQTVVTLSGERSRDVLAKGCSLDLHPREIRRGPMRPDPRSRRKRHPPLGGPRALLRPHSPPQLRRPPSPMAPRRRPRVRYRSRRMIREVPLLCGYGLTLHRSI